MHVSIQLLRYNAIYIYTHPLQPNNVMCTGTYIYMNIECEKFFDVSVLAHTHDHHVVNLTYFLSSN